MHISMTSSFGDSRDVLGHDLFGSGPRRVVILNDWLCDTSTWDGARAYLDDARMTYAFTDLRGYGRSRGRAGRFDVTEAAGDVIALADALHWPRFAVVGHSMSTLVALHLAQHHADRIERAVVLTPPPPTGFGADEAAIAASRAMAEADAATQLAWFKARGGGRLSDGWTAFKAARWRATADLKAASAYLAMFMRDGLPDPSRPIGVPLLAVAGDEDAPVMQREAVARALSPLGPNLVVAALPCGHYPMQEMPPRLVTLMERFLAGEAEAPNTD
jgi:pimeloyl-ACP methyl ester carboxylesterase